VRLWTIHPMHLDAKGLVAVWREALLAQAVLRNKTRGYKHHPQLARFRAHKKPTAAIALYLACILEEAQRRGYNFDATKIVRWRECDRIEETRGQLAHEWEHLRTKLRARSPKDYRRLPARPNTHPLFILIRGSVRDWERVASKAKSARKSARARPSPRPSRRSPS